ncbi:MAG: hypothetical protein ACLFOY_14455, partial [Desulfatibacillaceae bacterium]
MSWLPVGMFFNYLERLNIFYIASVTLFTFITQRVKIVLAFPHRMYIFLPNVNPGTFNATPGTNRPVTSLLKNAICGVALHFSSVR